MPIIDLQRRIQEAGRVRIGVQVPAGDNKTRPAKLETFRLTSSDKTRIEQAAGLWGGTVQPWQAPAGRQWEVITQATELQVIVPPADMAFSISYELWSAGGCQRRCDGQYEQISDGPCKCDPGARQCEIHTRLSLLLRDLPGLGVWRLDTQGYYAATELSGAVEVIQLAAGRGHLLPARLLLVQRQVKRPGDDGKPVTRKFAVPVLDIEVTPGQLMAAPSAPLALPAGNGHAPEVDGSASLASANLTPVPATVKHHPAGSVAEQMRQAAEPQERKPRKNAAQPVPRTGIEPRTAAQAQADAADNPSAIRPYLPDTPDSEPDEPDDGNDPGTVTPPQIRKLHAALTSLKYDSRAERDKLLIICEVLAGRELTGPHQAQGGNPRSTKNLSRYEAIAVIDKIESCGSQDELEEMVVRIDTARQPQ